MGLFLLFRQKYSSLFYPSLAKNMFMYEGKITKF